MSARFVVAVAVLGSSMAFVDSTVVNVALPAMGRDLAADFASFQWTVDAYLCVLASFLLLGGSLGDHLGRRRIFAGGLILFAAASLMCGLAGSVSLLIAARALQGLGAALLVPGSLALLSTHFEPQARGRAIGTWSAWSALSTAAGPILGGWLVDAVSWRAVFFLNLPVAALALFLLLRHVPRDVPRGGRQLDWPGGVLAAIALFALVFALVELPGHGPGAPRVWLTAGSGLVALSILAWWQTRAPDPMIPLTLFSTPGFVVANLMTFLVYFGFTGALFLMILQLQIVAQYSALAAGASMLPVTISIVLLSRPAGSLADRWRIAPLLVTGCLVVSGGLVLIAQFDRSVSIARDVLPATTVFGLGMALIVAPLTTSVFRFVVAQDSGIASGVNNAVARVASLLAVAVLPLAGRFPADPTSQPEALEQGFSRAILCAAGATLLGAIVSAAVTTPRPQPKRSPVRP